jgi:hypothetical protein
MLPKKPKKLQSGNSVSDHISDKNRSDGQDAHPTRKNDSCGVGGQDAHPTRKNDSCGVGAGRMPIPQEKMILVG